MSGTSSPPQIRLLIVDDAPSFRKGLGLILSAEPDIDVVGQAGDGADGVDAALRLKPDVTLMDLRMPRVDGFVATKVLSSDPHNLSVLAMTAINMDNHLLRAIHAGATGFLLKPHDPAVYAEAVRATARGHGYLSPGAIPPVVAAIRSGKQLRPRCEPSASPAERSVTEREVEILKALSNTPHNDKAIGRKLSIQPSTVKGHLKRIMAKLDLHSRADLVAWTYRSGYMP